MTVEGEINGLYPTPTRLDLVAAVAACDGGVYFAPAAMASFWDGRRVTARTDELLHHKWIRPADPGERVEAEWSDNRTYFRLTEFGEQAHRATGTADLPSEADPVVADAMAQAEVLLTTLVDLYRDLRARDQAQGMNSDHPALGGVGLAVETLAHPMLQVVVCLAVRQLAETTKGRQ